MPGETHRRFPALMGFPGARPGSTHPTRGGQPCSDCAVGCSRSDHGSAPAGWASPARAYPTQNITVTVAFPAGGIADVIARLVAQKLGERLRHTVVVENRGGAGGNIAAKAVSAAAADGHSILATTTALAVNETASRNKGFAAEDLRAIAIVAFSPDVIAVHPSNPAMDLKQFIDNGKDKSFTFGSAGVGTGPHIAAEYFFREVAKVKAVHVPFTGGAPAVQSAIGNHVDSIALTFPRSCRRSPRGSCAASAWQARSGWRRCRTCRPMARWDFPTSIPGPGSGSLRRRKRRPCWRGSMPRSTDHGEPEAQERLKTLGFEPIIKTQMKPPTTSRTRSPTGAR